MANPQQLPAWFRSCRQACLRRGSSGTSLTALVASESWMEAEESAAGWSLSRFFSISATDWRRLSRLSWTLWDWAMDFCSRSERSAICWERLWKRFTMASAEFSAKENQWQRASRLMLREQQGSPLAPAKFSLTTNPHPQSQQRDRGSNTNGQPGSQPSPRANTSPQDVLLCASSKNGRLHLFSPPWFVFTLSPTIPANAGSCFALYLLFLECVRGLGLAPLVPPARTELLSGASPPAPDAQQGLPAAAALTRDKAKSAVGHTQETCTHGELRVPFKPC